MSKNWTLRTIKISKKYNAEQRRAIAAEIVDHIKQRTKEGKGKGGVKWQPPADKYSKAYKDLINFKFKEDITLDELNKYIDQTYDQHYANGKYQATDMIIDSGYGEGFCIGNIMKYAMRYGKKNGKQRSDLLKIIHYAMIALYVNDESDA